MPQPDDRPIGLAVVIPCRNAADDLGEALTALASERLGESWEVIVVDNGSRDQTKAVARSFEGCLPLRIVDAPETKGPGYARNVGAAEARGEHLLFLDSDDVIAPGYLACMVKALARADLVAAQLDGERLNPGWIARSRPLGLEGGLNRSLEFLPFATSACLGVRRATFESLGGFADMRAGEDVDLCWRAQLAGFTLEAAAGAVLRYRFRHTLPGIFRQAVGYGARATPVVSTFPPRRHASPRHPPGRAATGGSRPGESCTRKAGPSTPKACISSVWPSAGRSAAPATGLCTCDRERRAGRADAAGPPDAQRRDPVQERRPSSARDVGRARAATAAMVLGGRHRGQRLDR